MSYKNGPAEQGRSLILTPEAAQTAENLPDGAAVRTAAVIAVKKEHLTDLLYEFSLAKTSIL